MHINNYSLQNWFFQIDSSFWLLCNLSNSWECGITYILFKSLFYVIMIQNVPWKEDIEGKKPLFHKEILITAVNLVSVINNF